jgi:glycogen debranching enzyme
MPELAQDQFAIVTSAARGSEPTRVLKHDDTFAVLDRYGDILPIGLGEHGIYHLGVRHLSRKQLGLAGHRPLLLSSSVREDNDLLDIDLTNPDVLLATGDVLPHDVVHVYRSILLWKAGCYERLRLVSFAMTPISVSLAIRFDADFADIFEVRGMRRANRGVARSPDSSSDEILLSYRGLDDVERRTRIHCSPRPTHMQGREITYDLRLAPQEDVELLLTISCESDEAAAAPVLPYDVALEECSQRMAHNRARQATLEAGNQQVDTWLRRSTADLQMMVSDTSEGPYPYAGVPWFSTIFGRDGLITALQLLWVDPAIARGVLACLASSQARDYSDAKDAQPGKILHETRRGEMAALGEIPFGQYYGTVDATPLFVLLAGEYWQRTGDLDFVRSLWPAIDRALHWIDTDGDPDQDGFVEYSRSSADGLVQQGWKDSQDSVFHADGSLAPGPIALCEVQAYTYAARLAAAHLADALGSTDRGAVLRRQAERLRDRFDEAFWLPDLSTYALALDGHKRPCRVVSSNAGQCLFTGICKTERAAQVALRMMEDDAFSEWGVRTIARGQSRYNPMAYHNGSVWPHDNALIAFGMGRYRMTDLAARITTGMFDASVFVDLHRLPELFCGFRRRPGVGPTLYPVACAPQAWAAGAVFMLLQSCLGLSVDAVAREIRFVAGTLPEMLPWLRITNLHVGAATVDLLVERHTHDLGIHVLRRTGPVEVVTIR